LGGAAAPVAAGERDVTVPMAGRATRRREPAGRAIDVCYELGWTDGLPVIPPEASAVEGMLAGRDPLEVVGVVPPLGGVATMEKLAANAVMAGCLPEHFAIVVAAVRAVCAPEFNLAGLQATTHVAAPLVIVSGPVVERVGLNPGYGTFGPGNRGNASIGRALGLVLWNLGGARPGLTDMSTFGQPGKYVFCMAERQEINPWPPHHVRRGFAPGDSVVTVMGCEAPKSIVATNLDVAILKTAAEMMSTLGSSNVHLMGEMLLVLGNQHARTLAAAGWTPESIQRHLFATARRRVAEFREVRTYSEEVWRQNWPGFVTMEDSSTVPVVERPEDIRIVVAGGDAGRFSLCAGGWGAGGRSVAVAVEGEGSGGHGGHGDG